MSSTATATQGELGEPQDEFMPPAAAGGASGQYQSAELDDVIQSWLRAAIPVAGRGYQPKMRTPNK